MRARNLLWIPLLGVLVSGACMESAGGGDISWSTMDGGGGTSAGETYRVSGSTGQPDAGTAASSGYDLLGGFWGGIRGKEPITPTDTPTPSLTSTATSTAAETVTHTPTETPTGTPTDTPPPSITGTPTPTATGIIPLPTSTPSPTDTAVPVSPTPAATQTTPTATGTKMASATPTVTPTATETPMATASATPTATGTPIPGDTNGDGRVDASDIFHFSKYWGYPADEADPRCNPVSDSVIDEKDLLSLTQQWKQEGTD